MKHIRRPREVCERFWKFVIDHPDKNWYWSGLSENPNITWEIVRDNPTKKWDYYNGMENVNSRDNLKKMFDYLKENKNLYYDGSDIEVRPSSHRRSFWYYFNSKMRDKMP